MAYHVQIAKQGFNLHVSNKFNLTADQVETQFVETWATDTEIVLDGRVFKPSESTITVLEGEPVSREDERASTAWLKLYGVADNVTDQFVKVPPGARVQHNRGHDPSAAEDGEGNDPRAVGVVHGRDNSANKAMFDFLRALDLRPLEWTKLVERTGSAAPSNREIVETIFTEAQAVVILATPDEQALLRPELATPETSQGPARLQPRPNVLVEAGMALAHKPKRTVFVQIGNCELPSDLDGINAVRLGDSAQALHALTQRLEAAGCAVDRSGTDWLDVNRFAFLGAANATATSHGTESQPASSHDLGT